MPESSRLSYVLVAAASAAAGVLAALGAAALTPPPTLSEAGEATSAAITVSQFRDERLVAAEVEAAQSVAGTLNISGTVTSSACVPGGELRSGTVMASVSSRTILGLHTAVPFYRDIGPGAGGPDVDALRTQLAAMDYPVARDGAYSQDLAAALLKLQTDFKLQNRDGVLHQEEVLWLPSDNVRVQSCDALLGSRYSAGSPFITMVGSLRSLRVVFPPDQPAAPGERRVTFDGISAPMAADGLVTDPKFLAKVSSSPDFVAAQSSSSPKPMSLRTELSSPLEVAKVPLSAVFGVRGKSACVRAPGGTTFALTIAGSSAGSVLAKFADDVPGEVLLGNAIGTSECPG